MRTTLPVAPRPLLVALLSTAASLTLLSGCLGDSELAAEAGDESRLAQAVCSPVGTYSGCQGTCGCQPKTGSPIVTSTSVANECGGTTSAIVSGNTVIAWGMTATLSTDCTRLSWPDGSTWVRTYNPCRSPVGRYSGCQGSCGCQPKTGSPTVTSTSVTNECGGTTSAVVSGNTVTAWGMTATLSTDGTRLSWPDGSTWVRTCN